MEEELLRLNELVSKNIAIQQEMLREIMGMRAELCEFIKTATVLLKAIAETAQNEFYRLK